MGLGDPPCDRKPQTGTPRVAFAAGTRFVCAEEALKNTRLEVGWNARSGVGYPEKVLIARAVAVHIHTPPRWTVLDGVVQKVEQHTAEQVLVGFERQLWLNRAGDSNTLGHRQRAGAPQNIGDQFIDIDLAELQRILPGVGARKCEQILDNMGEALRLVAQNRQRFPVFGGSAV